MLLKQCYGPGSGSDLFDKKIYISLGNFFFAIVQFVFDYIHIFLENFLNALNVFWKSHYVHLKYAIYLVDLVSRVGSGSGPGSGAT
jgi:hypothetical protein